MTAMGWIVVLGPVGVYALLVFACWRAVKKGPREWTDPEHLPPPNKPTPGACTSRRCRSGRRP
jgi:hypothetical protein